MKVRAESHLWHLHGDSCRGELVCSDSCNTVRAITNVSEPPNEIPEHNEKCNKTCQVAHRLNRKRKYIVQMPSPCGVTRTQQHMHNRQCWRRSELSRPDLAHSAKSPRHITPFSAQKSQISPQTPFAHDFDKSFYSPQNCHTKPKSSQNFTHFHEKLNSQPLRFLTLIILLLLACSILPSTTATYQVFSIGLNANGQLGHNNNVSQIDAYTAPPLPVQMLSQLLIQDNTDTCFDEIAFVSAGHMHSVVTSRLNGLTYGFGGQATYGSIGDGTDIDRMVPSRTIAPLNTTRIRKAVAGAYHTLFLAYDGRMFATGNNDKYQLGANDGTGTGNKFTPVAVDMSGVLNGVTIVDMSAGGGHNMVIDDTGKVYSWGDNGFGQLGDKSFFPREAPVAIDTSTHLNGKVLAKIWAGLSHSLVLSTSGEVFAAGNNQYGQMGDGTTVNKWEFILINGGGLVGKTVVAISSGLYHSLFLTSDNLVFGTGKNSAYELGDTTQIQRTLPTQMVTTALGSRTIVALHGGSGFTLLLTSSGEVFGVGLGAFVAISDLTQLNTNGLNITQLGRTFGEHALMLASCPDQSATMCNSRGVYTCDGVCHCCAGYTGASCTDHVCFGVVFSNTAAVCSGRGTCVGPNQCECAPGFHGQDCSLEYQCFDYPASDTAVCNGHGSCIAENSCSCNSSYGGQNCSTLCEVGQYHCAADGTKTLCGSSTANMTTSFGVADWSSWVSISSRNVSALFSPCAVVSHEWNRTSLAAALMNDTAVTFADSPNAASDPSNVYAKSLTIPPYAFRFGATHRLEAQITLANGQVVTEAYEVHVTLGALVSDLNVNTHIKVYSQVPVSISARDSYDTSQCAQSPQWISSRNNGQSSISYEWACYDYYSGEPCHAPQGTNTLTWTVDPSQYGVTSFSHNQVKVFVLTYTVTCLGTVRVSTSAVVAELVYGSPESSDGSGKTYDELQDRLKDLLDDIGSDTIPGMSDEAYTDTTESLWEFAKNLLNSNTTQEEKLKLIKELVEEVTEVIQGATDATRPESTCETDKEYGTLLLLERISTLTSLLDLDTLNKLNEYIWKIRGVCNAPELRMLMNITELVLKRSNEDEIEMDKLERITFDSFVVQKNTYSLCASARDIRVDSPYYAASFYETQSIILKLEKKQVSDRNMDTCTVTLKSDLFGPESAYYSPAVATSKEDGGMSVIHILRAERWREGLLDSSQQVTGNSSTTATSKRNMRYDISSVTVPHAIHTLGAHWFATESDPVCLEARVDDARAQVTWRDSSQCRYEVISHECHCEITTLEHGTLDLYGTTIIAVGLSQLSSDEQTWVVIVFTVSLALCICLMTLCIMCCVSVLLRLASSSMRIMEKYRNKQRIRRQIHDYSDFAQKHQVSKDDIIGAWSPRANKYTMGTKQHSLDKFKKLYEINHGVLRASHDDLYGMGLATPPGGIQDETTLSATAHHKEVLHDASFGTLEARSNSFDTLSAE